MSATTTASEPADATQSRVGGSVKPLPSAEQGLRVFEFFSGIGGMRAALPRSVRGIPLAHCTAFEINQVANAAYAHNFHQFEATAAESLPAPSDLDDDARRRRQNRKKSAALADLCALDGMRGTLRCCDITSLRLADVDGRADIWTLSPPCQPYTTTREARQRDAGDMRANPLRHLMQLLRDMQLRPRWIVLENVQGFVASSMLRQWKRALRRCGYQWRDFVLSPHESVGVPNYRSRYYFTAEWVGVPVDGGDNDDDESDNQSEPDCEDALEDEDDASGSMSASASSSSASASATKADTIAAAASSGCTDDDGSSGDAVALTNDCTAAARAPLRALPRVIRAHFPAVPPTLAAYVHRDLSAERRQQLCVPLTTLQQPWAPSVLSVVGARNRHTFCFTKAYARRFDRSAGSCFLDDGDDGIDDGDGAAGGSDDGEIMPVRRAVIDRDFETTEALVATHGRLRKFDPAELAAIAGFPRAFAWPESLTLAQRWACIGNSVNVTVVRAVMRTLFGDE